MTVSPGRRLLRNIATNYLAVLWLGVLTLALIPWYNRTLGPQQWGLVAVCISLQGFMTLLDVGLGQIMPRDIARAGGRQEVIARTFHVFSRAYQILAVVGCALGQIAAPWVAHHWLNVSPEGAADAVLVLRVVLLQFLFQFANNAHIGYWNGLQAQVTANARQCLFTTTKHVAAMLLVQAWKPSALAYLLPFVLFSSLEYLANRREVLRGLGSDFSAKVARSELRALASETSVLAAGVFIGMLISQMDRLLLSGSVDVTAFGRYVIVANLGLAFMQLQHPLVRAFLPRLVATRGKQATKALKQMGASILALCVLPCLTVGVMAPSILHLWTGDPLVVQDGTLPLRLILAAVALNGMYQVVYQQLLLHGLAGLIFKINLAILVIIVPLSMVVVGRYGVAGGGMIWLAVSSLQLMLGGWLIRRAVT